MQCFLKVISLTFQEEEKSRRENLDKIMEENQMKIEEQQKKMVSFLSLHWLNCSHLLLSI